jgi:predicted ferric reductase
MCGPPAMMNTMAKGFESLGIRCKQIRWEQFNIR